MRVSILGPAGAEAELEENIPPLPPPPPAAAEDPNGVELELFPKPAPAPNGAEDDEGGRKLFIAGFVV